MRNEAGLVVNDGDYAAGYTFSPDADVVGYHNYNDSAGPHVTTTISLRSTSDATLLWTTEVEPSAGQLAITGDHVVVEVPPAESHYQPWAATEALAVFDLATGTRVGTIPTTLQIIHLS